VDTAIVGVGVEARLCDLRRTWNPTLAKDQVRRKYTTAMDLHSM